MGMRYCVAQVSLALRGGKEAAPLSKWREDRTSSESALIIPPRPGEAPAALAKKERESNPGKRRVRILLTAC